MKILGLLFLTLIAFSSSHEVALKVTPIDFVKCVFASETLLKDINRVIELVKEGDYMKLVLELIEMFPKAYEEVNKCLNPEVVLYAGQKLKCIMDNRTFYTCTWYSKDSCCNLGGVSCKKLALPKLCQKRIRWTEVSRIEKEINSE